MSKKLDDIKSTAEAKRVDLRSNAENDLLHKKADKLKRVRNMVVKKKTPITEVKDLSGGEKPKFLYVKGKKFTPPRYLGNIMKIGLIGFALVMILNSVNVYYEGVELQAEIEAQAYEGFSMLVSGGENATKIQFESALASFEEARENFEKAEGALWFIDNDNSFYAKDESLGQAINALLRGGEHFAVAGGYFLEALELFNSIPVYFVHQNSEVRAENPSLTDTLKEGLEKTNLAIEEINGAVNELESVNEKILPSEIQLRITLAKEQVAQIAEILNQTASHFPAILKLLGADHPHRYMVLLQNNNEIRATGGFIGSYAIIDINEGMIEKLEVNDVYDIDGSYGGIIEPPEEFYEFTSNWRFRDSNYSPDFPTSAAKARWFLEKEGGDTVDTVIGINQGLLRDLLQITGPIQVGDFGALNADNYLVLLSYVIEGKVWGAEDPKHILKIFIPEFQKAILKEENLGRLSSKLYKAVQQKHIMVYSSDQEIQELLEATGLTGATHETQPGEDYLSVINIATGGTKSEQFMEEKIDHNTEVSKDGQITDTVTIFRTHNWTDDIYYKWKGILQAYGFSDMPDKIIDILGRGENKVLTRVYVPDGAILMEEGSSPDVEAKYDADLKKTYFLVHMNTKAGETSTVTIQYKLPFTIDLTPTGTYKLVIDKQPGSRGSILNKTISFDSKVDALEFYPEDTRASGTNEYLYATNLVYDRYFSAILRR